MKEQKLHQGHFDKKPQKAVKSGQYRKTRQNVKIFHAAKFHAKISYGAKISNHAKISHAAKSLQLQNFLQLSLSL